MQFYYIRHAQSVNNQLFAEHPTEGERRSDPELTDVGWQQARALASFLRGDDPRAAADSQAYDPQNVQGFGITHLYSSLMVRAVQTGSVVAEALELPLRAWPEIHESGGIYEEDEDTGELVGLAGKGRSYFQTRFPRLQLPESLDDTGWWNRPYETEDERRPRARRCYEALLDRHGGTEDRVAIISHGGFYNHLLRVVLDLPEDPNFWFLMNNAAITRINFGESVDLIYTNRVDHLPDELIT